MGLIGYFDNIKNFKVSGWASVKGANDPVQVDIRINEKKESIVANIKRVDLKEKGLHPTGACAFIHDIKHLLPLEDRFVEVHLSVMGEPLNGSPRVLILNHDLESENKLALIHIPKTAGTSVNNIFEKHFANDEIITHLESKPAYKNQSLLNNFKFVSGHVIYGQMKELINDKFKTAIVFRNPIDQLISHINWVKNISADVNSNFFKNHSEEIKELSLSLREMQMDIPDQVESFISNLSATGITLFDNCQTRYLLNLPNRGRFLDMKNFYMAAKNLDSINFVGVTKDLSSFIKKINSNFKLDLDDNVKKLNIRTEKSIITKNEMVLNAFYPLIQFDLKIYEKALRLTKYN